MLNPDILRRKQIVFDNNVMKRKKEKCKVIYNGTIWSLKDIYMDRRDFLENNPEAKDIRWDVIFDSSEKKITKPKVVNMIIEHDVGSAYFESNQGGEGYKDEVDALLKENGKKINLVSKYAPTDKRKKQRIWDKAGSIRDWYFRDTGCRSKEYRNFMRNLYSFTIKGRNTHDDAPDCLASLAYFIEGTWEPAKIEPIKNPFRGGY